MLSGGRRIEQQKKEASAYRCEQGMNLKPKLSSNIKDTPHHELRVSRGSNLDLRVCAPSGSGSLMSSAVQYDAENPILVIAQYSPAACAR